METAVSVFLVLLFVHQIVGPPVTTKNIKESQNENEANSTIQLVSFLSLYDHTRWITFGLKLGGGEGNNI